MKLIEFIFGIFYSFLVIIAILGGIKMINYSSGDYQLISFYGVLILVLIKELHNGFMLISEGMENE